DIANSFIDYFNLADTIDGGYETVDNYYSDPSPENLGAIFGFVGTQAAGQIAGNIVDKFLPTAGEKFLWEAVKNQFDDSRGYEDERSRTDLKKKALGFLIGLILERVLDETNNALSESEYAQSFWDRIFPAYDWAVEGVTDFLSWWDPLGVNSGVNTDFLAALNFIQRRDPLTLDLDGDGIETVSSNSGIVFDFDGDGLKTGTGWVKGDDGLLVLDHNGNGYVDNGRELFGVDTLKSNGQKAVDGFDALRDLDSNGDGVFDTRDIQFANVQVWQDLNQDGVSQANELKTLTEHNITVINLEATTSSEDSNGNLISAVGSFVRGDGSVGEVNGNQSLAANLDLASNPFYRQFTDRIALDTVAQGLPDMQGSGAVRDLREASMLNPSLKGVLAEYSTAETRQEQLALLDRVLAEWAKSSGYRTFDKRVSDLNSDSAHFIFSYSWERPQEGAGFGGGSGGGSGSGGSPTDGGQSTGPTAAQLAQKELLERAKILEVFNSQNFFNFTATERTDSNGNKTVDAVFGAGAMRGGSGSFGGGAVAATATY
ncbi:hypothetical protein DOQ73_23490, partial [Salmonella enterica subsp. enterica]|nr:hypothetical protein [Salmonella enterica subsp. enterica serovar Javiana]